MFLPRKRNSVVNWKPTIYVSSYSRLISDFLINFEDMLTTTCSGLSTVYVTFLFLEVHVDFQKFGMANEQGLLKATFQ